MVRSAWAVALDFGGWCAAILHSLHYGFPVALAQEDHNANYVNIAWDGFYGGFFVLRAGATVCNCEVRATCKVLL